MATLIKNHPLVAYYFLTFALSWSGFVIVLGPTSLVNTNWQAEGLFSFVLNKGVGPALLGKASFTVRYGR